MALQTARSNTGEAFMEHSVKCLTFESTCEKSSQEILSLPPHVVPR